MKRIFSLILFVIFSNKVIASVEGETIICDKDTRGYNFISKDKVKISSINLNLVIQKILNIYETVISKNKLNLCSGFFPWGIQYKLMQPAHKEWLYYPWNLKRF